MNGIHISIIIATRNRPAVLWQTVLHACAAIAGKPAEIIVVNDGDVMEIPQAFVNSIIFINNDRKGVSVARNTGAAKAQGEVLFIIDDDMWINSEAINWIIKRFNNHPNDRAVYNLNWRYPDTLTEKLDKTKIGRYILSSRYHTMWGRMCMPGAAPAAGLFPYNAIASGSLVISKTLFTELGGYSTSISFQGEDIELSNRIRNAAINIFAVFDVTLFHNQQDRLTISDHLKRVQSGYVSEFKTVQMGLIKPVNVASYQGLKKYLFEGFRITQTAWITLFKIIPNGKLFTPLSNRLIGLLSGLERYKQWRNVFITKSH